MTFSEKTGIIPSKDIDVILVAPKGSGTTVRKHFKARKGINSNYAIYQDATGHAEEKVLAMGIGVGSGFLFKTTFQKEVYSDLTGERGVLMGAIAGLMEAQYNLLRKQGHSPSEAFNETVEEATQSLYPLIGENGMDRDFGLRSEEHTSELQSPDHLVCRLLLEKKKKTTVVCYYASEREAMRTQ